MNWLANFPSTNAVVFSGIGLSWATLVSSWIGWKPPEGWLLFVAGCLGIGAGQFAAKRLTHREPFGSVTKELAEAPERTGSPASAAR